MCCSRDVIGAGGGGGGAGGGGGGGAGGGVVCSMGARCGGVAEEHYQRPRFGDKEAER